AKAAKGVAVPRLLFRHLQPHALFRHNHQLSALFGCLAEEESRHGNAFGGLCPRASEAYGKLLLAIRFTFEMKRYEPAFRRLQFCPMTQGASANRLHIQAGGKQEADSEKACAR